MVIGTAAVGGGDHHELSMVMVGACRGGQPASKVSMTIMRPPQQGAGSGQCRRRLIIDCSLIVGLGLGRGR
ncbi:MAG TPA: hypothetical protein VE665_05770 [Hyphomicrobiaceae bacterium]|jgi:hypothetical protein|nr:hypothetical protein [Hyphomicrobiaceae bacterium]